MKIFLSVSVILQVLICSQLRGQDEGIIAARERLDRSRSFYFSLGLATSLQQNNYKGGAYIGLGFQKRLNRVISAGGGVAYLNYRVDYADFMTGKYFDEAWNNEQPTNFYYTASQGQYYLVNLSGGDVSMASVHALIKINFVPIKSATIASLYGAIAPSLVLSTLDRIESNINFFEHPTLTAYNQVNNRSFVTAKSQSTWTGGVLLSLGVEFFPTNVFSFHVQTDFGYYFPLPFVDTSLYQDRVLGEPYYNPFEDYPLSENFPLTDSKGFSTLNFRLGLSYNF